MLECTQFCQNVNEIDEVNWRSFRIEAPLINLAVKEDSKVKLQPSPSDLLNLPHSSLKFPPCTLLV